MVTPQAVTLVRNLIGQPNNQVIDGAVIYDTEYILLMFFVIVFVVGIFVLIVNFQKAITRGKGRF